MRVAVLVAAWEDIEQTLTCLRSILAQEFTLACELRLVVCDDCSAEAIVAGLTQAINDLGDPRVTLVTSSQRGGYAANINRGMEALGDFQADFFWLLNNDTCLAQGALDALLQAAAREPAVQVWGSTVVAGIAGDTIECAGGYRYSRLSTRSFGAHAGSPLTAAAGLAQPELDYVSGAAMFCRAALLWSAGGLSEDYFLYFEELDLLQRCQGPVRLGWCPGSLVYHAGASTTGRAGQRRTRLQQYCENYSTLLYTQRHDPLLLPWVLLSRLSVKPCKFLWRGEWHLFQPFAAAMADFLRGVPPRRVHW